LLEAIFKSGSKFDVKNYRPIAINSSLSKLFEKIVFDQTSSFLNKNNLLYDLQFGFSHRRGTETALLYLLSRVISLRQKSKIAIMFLDFSKAFDSINHNRIILKLRRLFGFGGTVLNWFQSYLNNRTQHVSIDLISSESLSVKYGVPQGSILGPLLFKLFINDIHKCSVVGSEILLYADDVAIIAYGSNWNVVQKICNEVLLNISMYCVNNQLFLNIGKSAVMRICPEEKSIFQVNLDNDALSNVDQYKYLGFWLQSDLKFDTLSNNLLRKLSFSNLCLSRASRFINRKSTLLLYQAFHLSYITYFKSILHMIGRISFKKIASKLTTAGSIIMQCSRLSVNGELFNLSYLVDFYTYLFLFRLINGMSDKKLFSLVHFSTHVYNTRSSHFFQSINIRKSDDLSIEFFLPKMWNKLPSSLRAEKKISKFRKELNIYLKGLHV